MENKPVTVAQLIEYLKQQPAEAVVQVGYEESYGYDVCVRYDNISLGDCMILDFTLPSDKGTQFYGKKFLRLLTNR